jgi:hypothetical protein
MRARRWRWMPPRCSPLPRAGSWRRATARAGGRAGAAGGLSCAIGADVCADASGRGQHAKAAGQRDLGV